MRVSEHCVVEWAVCAAGISGALGRKLRFAPFACLVTLLLGCGPISGLIDIRESSSTSTELITTTKPNLPACRAPELRLTHPLVVNAIGISQYGRASGHDSTPAHMLGAAIFHQPLKVAAWRTQQMMRNELTFGSSDSPAFAKPVEKSSVTAIAVSGNDTLVAVARFTARGSAVTVSSRDGKILHQFSRGAEIVGLRFVGNDLLLLQAKDNTVHLTLLGGTERSRFPHAADIRTMDVDPQGTRLLVSTSDGRVHLWQLDSTGTASVFSLPEKSCFDSDDAQKGAVRFDDSGTRLLTTRCDGVGVYDALRPAALLVRLAASSRGATRSLEISADGTHTAAVTAEGQLQLNKVSGFGAAVERSQTYKGTAPYVGDARPMFSRDGRKVALKTRDGAYDIWQLDAMQTPTFVVVDRGVTTLHFSSNGRSLVGGTALRAFGWNIEAAQREGQASFAQAMTLVSPLLAAEGSRASLAALAVANSGAMAWVGMTDGTVQSFGLETTAAIESRFHVNFDADIYRPKAASMAQAVSDPTYSALTSIGGIDWLEDRMFFNMGMTRGQDERPPTRTRQAVMNLQATFFQAEQAHKYNGSVMLILYVAAHGWIGADGKPVVLPGDAVESDSTSWIPYQWFVDQVDKFVGTDGTRRAVIIFDTCQRLVAGERVGALGPQSASPYVTIVESASPGQYAWHWRVESQFSSDRTVTSESRFGFPYLPPKAPRGKSEATLSTTMSVFPLTSTCVLSAVADELRAKGTDPFRPRGMSVGEWLELIAREAQDILIKIPDKNTSGYRQEITRHGGTENDHVRLFGFK